MLREEFLKILRKECKEKRLIKDLQILLIEAKKFKLLTSKSQKEISIPDESLYLLEKIASFLIYLNENETKQLRTAFETQKLINNLLFCQLNRKLFTVLGLLCPSYKKGINCIGFNKEIGETTKRGIKNIKTTLEKLQELNFLSEGVVVFSDLVVENYNEMINNNQFLEIKHNIASVKDFVFKNAPNLKLKLLSDFENFKEIMPVQGIDGEPDLVSKDLFNIVLKRNKTFYGQQFGWPEEKIIKRTKILACSYPVIGDFFRKEFSPFLFVYTANSLERARMYQGTKEKTNPIPIFFPTKIKHSS